MGWMVQHHISSFLRRTMSIRLSVKLSWPYRSSPRARVRDLGHIDPPMGLIMLALPQVAGIFLLDLGRSVCMLRSRRIVG